MWVVALESGIEPLVVGLAFGLLLWAAPAARTDLEHAGKRFREQPTPGVPARRPREHQDRDLAQRAPAAHRSPVDELLGRPAVRAGRCGHRDRRSGAA